MDQALNIEKQNRSLTVGLHVFAHDDHVNDAPENRKSPMRRALDLFSSAIRLVRPRQWLKNGLVVLAPLVTAPTTLLTNGTDLAVTVLAFTAAASTVYVFNDIRDRDRDRLHPVKRLRPLASGRVSMPAAVILLVLLVLLTLLLAMLLPSTVALVIAGYLAINLWYCLALKHQPLVDVFIVASGFVLRTVAGSFAAKIELWPSLLICVYCACLAMSLGKRRHELAKLADNPAALLHRPALSTYSVQFLDLLIVINLVAALVGYVSFIWLNLHPYGALTAGLTFPFAAFAVSRYLQMVTVQKSGGDPVSDLSLDRTFAINGLIWAALLATGVFL